MHRINTYSHYDCKLGDDTYIATIKDNKISNKLAYLSNHDYHYKFYVRIISNLEYEIIYVISYGLLDSGLLKTQEFISSDEVYILDTNDDKYNELMAKCI